MNPEQIKELQRQLAAQGFYTGKIDGVMGPSTQQAMALAQQGKASALEEQRLQNQKLEQERLIQAEKNRAAEAARRAASEAEAKKPVNQAINVLETAVPIGVGIAGAHKIAKGIEGRQLNMRDFDKAGFLRRFAPYLGKSATYLLPEGYYLREHVAPQFENETTRDIVRDAGTGLMAGGAGVVGEGFVRSLTPPKVPGATQAVQASTPAPAISNAAPAQTSAATPAASLPAEPEAVARPHSERLTAAARQAGATGKLTKSQAADFITSNLGDPATRAAVGRELGVAQGPNFQKRILEAVDRMKSTAGKSSVLGPIVAGGVTGAMMGYDAATNQAKAAGLSDTGRTAAGVGGAIAGGAAGGAAVGGLAKGAQALYDAIPSTLAGRVAGRTVGPVANALLAYDAAHAIAHGLGNSEDARGADFELRGGNLPFFERQQAVRNVGYGGDRMLPEAMDNVQPSPVPPSALAAMPAPAPAPQGGSPVNYLASLTPADQAMATPLGAAAQHADFQRALADFEAMFQ